MVHSSIETSFLYSKSQCSNPVFGGVDQRNNLVGYGDVVIQGDGVHTIITITGVLGVEFIKAAFVESGGLVGSKSPPLWVVQSEVPSQPAGPTTQVS